MECFLRLTTALLLVSFMSIILPCHSSNRLRPGESISGNMTLVSSGGVFALGFFSPTGSAVATGSWYVGIWHKQVPATERRIVWVANREKPVTNPPGVLCFTVDGNLVVSDGDGNPVWSSNSSSSSSSSSANDTSAVLLHNGNLVVAKGEGHYLWRSFDHPTDTILPDMSFTLNHRTKVADSITCWWSDRDPSPGNFSYGIDPATSFQFMMERGGKPYCRTQVLVGKRYLAMPNNKSVNYLTFNTDNEWVNATFALSDPYSPNMAVLNHTGVLEMLEWNDSSKKWLLLYSLPSDNCDSYASCGEFGVCDINARPHCKCLEGFEPKNRTEWDRGDFRRGCARKKPLQCENGDRFSRIDKIKLPDHLIFFENVSSSDCKKLCSRNCSCTAYTHSNTVNNTRLKACFLWTGELVDLVSAPSIGYHLHLRLAAGAEMGKRTKTIILVVIIPVSIALLCASLLCCFFTSKRKKRKGPTKEEEEEAAAELKQEGADLPFFEFELLVAATGDFSDSNKIGQGGFGMVYKGKITNELEIAIKRHSKVSRQGLEEFKNELTVIAKLQHKNLVRLLGYCVQEDEKILIYEFSPNGSLDSFLFSNEKRMTLDWEKRFNIIKGIARGLLYLHEDSRLRIIHRDLKASNILLDKDMNPKISDFGMARIFGSNQNEAKTVRVVGTYGYMSPEYTMKGHFSVKSDVYSYGVLVLEILSGKKSSSFHPSSFPSLVSYAWELWKDNQLPELVDPLMVGACHDMGKVSRCLLVALLCVQDRASDRPTMSSVVHMLENELVPVDRGSPKRPTFTAVVEVIHQDDINRDMSVVEIPQSAFSINDVTITDLHGR